MKKIAVLTLCLMFLSSFSLALTEMDLSPRVMVPGEIYHIRHDYKGEWTSNDVSVASIDQDGWIRATGEGCTVITPSDPIIQYELHITVEQEPEAPEKIKEAISIALREWEAFQGTRLRQSNKYTAWYYGPKASFGWCGAFTSYCLSEAGVPLEKTDTWRNAVPLPDGRPHGAREAAVPKLLAAFSSMDRVSRIPRPGYLVIYGNRGGYKTTHVGLVSSVRDMGDSVYLLETVEGNLGGRVKRLSYLYDSRTEDPKRNMAVLPETQQTQPDVFQYRLNDDNWRVTAFAQTWY